MKKYILLILLILLYLAPANGQWHVRTCSVPEIELASPEEFDCLWNKANTVTKVGKISFFTGVGVAAAGGLTMLVSDPCCSSGSFMAGGLVTVTGVVITALSIPIWTVGSSRLNKLRVSPAYRERSGASLGLSPWIEKNQFSQETIPGLALTFRF